MFQDSFYGTPTYVVEITLMQFSSLGMRWCENEGYGGNSYIRDPITSTAEGQMSFLFKIQNRSVSD